MPYTVHLSLKSANAKTGPIPVSTTTRATCPVDCAMREGCYASAGPLALHWSAVSSGARGTDWQTFVDAIALPPFYGALALVPGLVAALFTIGR